MIEIHQATQIFTPTSPARLNFVEREGLNERLVDALVTPGRQIVVYGESGSGKTTLLQNKLEQLYPKHIKTACVSTTSFDQLLVSALDKMSPFILSQQQVTKGKQVSVTAGHDFKMLKAQVELHSTNQSSATFARVLPPQLTPERIAMFLGEIEACWVIEDFHKVPASEKTKVNQILKVFCDMATEYPNLRIVLIGATETAREVIEFEPEMRGRIAEIEIPLMTDDEILQIISNGQRLLNVSFEAFLDNFPKYSLGVASVAHQLALNVCLGTGTTQTVSPRQRFTDGDFKKALERYVEESSDSLKATFEKALKRHRVRKYDNSRMILRALATAPLDGLRRNEIFAEIKKSHPEYPPSNLTTYLQQLQSEFAGHLIRATGEDKYRFASPLHHTFAQLSLLDAATLTKSTGRPDDLIRSTLLQIFAEMATEEPWRRRFKSWNNTVFDRNVKQLRLPLDDFGEGQLDLA